MPIFEFTCSQCQIEFDVLVANSEKDTVQCPECGTSEVRQKLSVFSSPKSAGGASGGSYAPMPPSCAGCAKAGGCGMNY